ncbi:hypothetical protein HY639_04520 [Candidatus Woesearchaeota archaeon]|nr:hypothetical protein [Candidatus Woesearchaeota archaeon]
MLRSEAIRILSAFPIPLVVSIGALPPLPLAQQYGGLFYTALLEAGADKVIADAWSGWWGYRLTRGVLELRTSGQSIGYQASGGIIVSTAKLDDLCWYGTGCTAINKGCIENHFAELASSGLFINDGQTTYFGGGAHGGTFVNHGKVYSIGISAIDGIFINHGYVEDLFGFSTRGGLFITFAPLPRTDIGSEANGGIYITTESHEPDAFLHDGENALALGPKELAPDVGLSRLVHTMRALTAKGTIPDIRAVNELAMQIRLHCKAKYGFGG